MPQLCDTSLFVVDVIDYFPVVLSLEAFMTRFAIFVAKAPVQSPGFF